MKVWGTRWFLLAILAIGLFWRVYNYEKGFSFAHDQDLYSWIAKDIVVNHHQRLVGQITSVSGVFIGSFYYYLIAFFYLLFRMDPMSAVIPITIIGLLNILSLYYVVFCTYGKKAGLWVAFIYAASFGAAYFDRWSVPTQPTVLWSIWFLYVIFQTYKGNWKVLPLYGFLVGFSWQIHIALLPILVLPILAYFIGDKIAKRLKTFSWKMAGVGILFFWIASSPFWIFEIKHNFLQIKSMVSGSRVEMGGPSGSLKLEKVLKASGKEMWRRLFFGFDRVEETHFFWLVLLLILFVLIKGKKMEARMAFLMSGWIAIILFAQFWSKRIVSEYYFTNLLPVVITIAAVALSQLKNSYFISLLAGSYIVLNAFWVITKTDDDNSYYYRRQIVEYIRDEVKKNNYPCIAVNFIADPGVGVGFRYLFWLNGVNLVKQTTDGVPVYNIFIPWQLMRPEENGVHFGRFGTALGKFEMPSDLSEKCVKQENQLDPLLGYTE